MSKMINILKNVFFYFIFFLPTLSNSQTIFRVKTHEILVSGTSNLHDWTAIVGKASGYCIIDTIAELPRISSISIEIISNSLKSSKGSIMDSKMNEALKTVIYPKITFVSKQTKLLKNTTNNIQILIYGVLTIAGVSKNIEIIGICKYVSNELLITMGSKEMKMTDFGVDPPTALFGALETANEIKIDFKINLSTTK